MKDIAALKPQTLFKHFAEILKIPRCSGNEEKIREYLVSYAKSKGYEYKVDNVGNVLIKVPATKGYEKAPVVVLQGHIDMVCEKRADYEHDFSKDPIPAFVDNDVIRTKGTTLGADNGIGVATALGIADADDIEHGPIECLFTIDEERGLTGASNLTPEFVEGRLLLNLDSEDEGILFVGCAGGGDTELTLKAEKEKTPDNTVGYELKIDGLLGGHSGLNINDNRGNALKLIARTLYHTKDLWSGIWEFKGGTKRNAIPLAATVKIAVSKGKEDEFESRVKEVENWAKSELKNTDPNVTFTLTKQNNMTDIWTKPFSIKLVELLLGLPHGVLAMSKDVEGVVQTSSNLAIVEPMDEEVMVVCSSRSSIESERDAVMTSIEAIGDLAGAKVNFAGKYPAWQPDMNAKTLSVTKEAFKRLFGKEPEVTIIHAGLETGVIGKQIPGMDMVSFGPNIRGAHTPDEYVEIPSTQRFYELVKEVLKDLARV